MLREQKKEKDGASSEMKDVFFIKASAFCGLTSQCVLYDPLSSSQAGRLLCKVWYFSLAFSQKTLFVVEIIPFVFV